MKQCEKCGNEFKCGSTSNTPCWCLSLPSVSNISKNFKDCLCPKCLNEIATKNGKLSGNTLKEGDDYYIEKGLLVFTEKYHVKKGYCCKNNCRHCPY